MNQAEIEYWDKVAQKVCKRGAEHEVLFADNWVKRQIVSRFLLDYQWSKQRVLEIGVGNGVVAAALKVLCGGMLDYTGTELAPHFISNAKRAFGLNIIQTDVLNLPRGPFDRVIALDSLEHVRHEEREFAFSDIANIMVDGGKLFINMPHTESLHEEPFEHGIGVEDIVTFEKAGLTLVKYERYAIHFLNGTREYAFVMMRKGGM